MDKIIVFVYFIDIGVFGKMHSALAYHRDHKKELDADIKKGLTIAKQTGQEIELSKIIAKLKSQGLI